jgi:hypothetical protein
MKTEMNMHELVGRIDELRHELNQIRRAVWWSEVNAIREVVYRIAKDMDWTIDQIEEELK